MKKSNLDNPFLTITLFLSSLVIVIVLAVFFAYERFSPTPVEEPTAVAEPMRPEFEFYGMRCTTLRQNPIFTYDVQRQTVTLQVECAPELMLNYFEAEESAGEVQEWLSQ